MNTKKMRVGSLSGPALDWLVAKAGKYDEGWLQRQLENPNPSTRAIPAFSTDWAAGGAIIEEEGINASVNFQDSALDGSMIRAGWKACYWNNSVNGSSGFMQWADGPTALIASMRVFVASRLGDEVEVPVELC